MVIRIVFGHRLAHIVLTDTSVLLPASKWSNREVSVDYDDLQEVYRSSWFSQSFINIVHRTGKLMIPISCLPSAKAFDAILNGLQDRMAG